MSPFDTAFNKLVPIEGTYSDHPSDKGGPTMYGITERVAHLYGYKGVMRELPLEKAREIYLEKYWNLMHLDGVARYSVKIADEMFDTGVNMGRAGAVYFLQIWLNAFNRRGSDYLDIEEDNLMGRVTLGALDSFLFRRGKEGEAVMLTALNCSQGERYRQIARTRPENEDFIYGWMRTRVRID